MNGQQLYRHWIGKDSGKDREAFHIWMSENPSHKWEYLYLQHLWENGPYLPDEKVSELAIHDFSGIQNRIETAKKHTKLFNMILGFAMFAIVLVVGGLVITKSESAVHLEIRNASLASTCQRLNREFGMHIKVAHSIQDCQINGTFVGNHPDSVLYRMARNFHVQCYRRGNTFFLDGKNCQN